MILLSLPRKYLIYVCITGQCETEVAFRVPLMAGTKKSRPLGEIKSTPALIIAAVTLSTHVQKLNRYVT